MKNGDFILHSFFVFFFNSYDFDGEHIIINTGGKADFRYYNGKFAASSDCLVVTSNICTAYVYYYLKKLIDVINDKYFTKYPLDLNRV